MIPKQGRIDLTQRQVLPGSDPGSNKFAKCWPLKLIKTIIEVIDTPKAPLSKHVFCLELTTEAAKKNESILKKYNYNLQLVLTAQQGTPLEYGSEFWKIIVLKKLFCHHPKWS